MSINISLLNQAINRQTQQLDTLYSKVESIENIMYNSSNGETPIGDMKVKYALSFYGTVDGAKDNTQSNSVKNVMDRYKNLGIEGYGNYYTFDTYYDSVSLGIYSRRLWIDTFYSLATIGTKLFTVVTSGYQGMSAAICSWYDSNTNNVNLVDPFGDFDNCAYKIPTFTLSGNTLTKTGSNINYGETFGGSAVIFGELNGYFGIMFQNQQQPFTMQMIIYEDDEE